MKAIYKAPGRAPELIDIGSTAASLRKKLGGEFHAFAVLKGAMILCRKEDPSLPYNVHFMGDSWHGPILLVGRGEGDGFVDLTPQLQTMLTTVLTQKGKA